MKIEQENLNRDNPQCEYVLEGKSFGHIFAVGYAKQIIKRSQKAIERETNSEKAKHLQKSLN